MTRIMRRLGLTLAIWLAAGAAVGACPVCFRIEDGPVSDGVRAAVIVLMGVTTAVLGGFAMFIVRFVRLEPRQAEPSNLSNPVEPSEPSEPLERSEPLSS
jgi:hypothetical protein